MLRGRKSAKGTALVILVCVVALLLVGFSPAWAKEKAEIRIGAHLPLSGPLASIGVEQKWAYEVSVEDVNKTGGIFVKEYNKKLPVQLVVLDDESDPGKAAACVERLVKQKKVDLLLSGHSAPFGVIPGCVSAEKYRKYYHASACFIPPWLEHNFQWSTIFFFDMAEAAKVPFNLLNQIPEADRPKKIGILMEDTFDGRALGGVIRDQASKMGYQFAYDEPLSPGAKDYTSQILKAKDLGVDAILIFSSTTDCVTFIRQMKENKFSVKFMQGWKGMWAAEFWQALGKDAQYLVSDGHWSQDYPFAGSRELGERYFQKFNKYSVSVGAFYGLTQILWQAIEKAGSLDSAKVRQAVINGEFNSVMGKTTYDERGVGIYPAPAFQWMDGKQMTVFPSELANHTLQLAPPWDQR